MLFCRKKQFQEHGTNTEERHVKLHVDRKKCNAVAYIFSFRSKFNQRDKSRHRETKILRGYNHRKNVGSR